MKPAEPADRIASLECHLRRAASVIEQIHKAIRPTTDEPNGEAVLAWAIATTRHPEEWDAAVGRARRELKER